MKKQFILLFPLILASCGTDTHKVSSISALTEEQKLICNDTFYSYSSPTSYIFSDNDNLIDDLLKKEKKPFKGIEEVYKKNDFIYIFKTDSAFIVKKIDSDNSEKSTYDIKASYANFGELKQDYQTYFPIDIMDNVYNFKFRIKYEVEYEFSEYTNFYKCLKNVTIDEINKTITTPVYYRNALVNTYKIVIHFENKNIWFTADQSNA